MYRPKVLITIPCKPPWNHSHVTRACWMLATDRRYETIFMTPSWCPYEHNLNRCAQEMRDRGCNYWLSIDADNPPLNNPLDLVELDLDLVGCPTPVWHDAVKGDRPWYFNALDWTDVDGGGWKPHEPCTGLQEVDAIGTGCFVASRRVFERLESPWFMREYDGRGRVERGHDYLFCKRIKESGMKVWAHFGYLCRHFVELDILTVAEAFDAMYQTMYRKEMRHG
uniref:Glycosyltransferase n=1 Tax=viral metagenome TaxID=1070528 RepID=A0A6M3L7U3_9ZZZZ